MGDYDFLKTALGCDIGHDWQFAPIVHRWIESKEEGATRINLYHNETRLYRHCTRCGVVQECKEGTRWQKWGGT